MASVIIVRSLLVTALLLFFIPQLAWAGPIYMVKEASGVIRFTSRPPPKGVRAEVFTGKGAHFSIVGGGRYYYGGWLFSNRYSDLIQRAANANAVEPALVKAIIHVESGFNPHAVSPKGAQGLMQLMPETARMYGVRRPFEPAENINAGTAHIAMLLKKYGGNLAHALAAYNAGEDSVSQYGGIPPFAETQEYVRRVMHMKKRYSLVSKD